MNDLNGADNMDAINVLDDLGRRAVADYDQVRPPEEPIRRQGDRRRRRRNAAWAASAVATLALAGVWGGVPRLLLHDGHQTVAVGTVPSGSSSPEASTSTAPPRLRQVDPRVGAELIEVEGCPTLSDVKWTVSVGSGPLTTAPMVAVSQGATGSALSTAYRAQQETTPGWLTQDPRPDVSVSSSGYVTVTELTPGADARHLPGNLVPSNLGCRTERWDRSAGTADADVVLLHGKAALLYVLGSRANGSTLEATSSPALPSAAMWRLRRGADEALVVDRRPDDVVVLRSAVGTLPTGDLLARWLSL